MKNRNKLIIGLIAVGVALFIIVQFAVIPHNNAEKAKYIAAQKEPATHDFGAVLKYKNKYMGNASNDANLFYNLPLGDVGMNFELFPKKLELEVNYKDTVFDVGEKKVKKCLLYNSAAAFALIDNLQIITYNFPGSSYQVKRKDIESLFPDFSKVLNGDNWHTNVQIKLKDKGFVQVAFQKAVKKI